MKFQCATENCPGDPKGPGGARGHCARCYRWRLRHPGELPTAIRKRSAPGDADQLTLRMPREFRLACSADAFRSGLEEAQWWRDAAAEKLTRERARF